MRKIECRKHEITIRNFIPVISDEQLEGVMGKQNANKFRKWMYGQTASIYGYYYEDLERWLNNLPVID